MALPVADPLWPDRRALARVIEQGDAERFDAEVARQTTDRAKADTILNRMKRTATEHMDEDPAFYRRFSDLIEEAIRALREGRLSEAEYLARAEKQLADMRAGRSSGRPAVLDQYRHAAAYFGVLAEALAEQPIYDDALAHAAIRAEEIIEGRRVTDWTRNLDVQNRIKQELDEHLWQLQREHGFKLNLAGTDMLIERLIEVAKARDRLP